MLRDIPPFHLQPQADLEILMNNPGTEDEPTRPSTEYIDPLDDVFGSAPASPTLAAQRNDDNTTVQSPSTRAAHPSDVPRLRSTHVTNGYREGIAASKEQHIQAGFDEGYSLGAEVALK